MAHKCAATILLCLTLQFLTMYKYGATKFFWSAQSVLKFPWESIAGTGLPGNLSPWLGPGFRVTLFVVTVDVIRVMGWD